MLILLIPLAAAYSAGAQGPAAEERRIGPYDVRIVETTDPADDAPRRRLEIARDGRVLLERAAEPYERLDFSDSAPVGEDLTGRGRPDIVIDHNTGGAHCCATALVFELAEPPNLVTEIDGGHGDGVQFEQRPGIGWIAVVADWTFAYWNTSFAESPACTVPLAYRGGKFRPVPELMRKPPFAAALLAQRAGELRADYAAAPADWPPPALWAVMLALVYSGNVDQVDAFFDQAWPEAAQGKAAFRHDFDVQLATSPYWPDLQNLHRVPAPPGETENESC
jgi:hypothetical protein